MPNKPDLATIDFDQNPFVVIWEATQACALKCVHCRAQAQDRRDPAELTTTEAFSLLDEIRRFGNPLVVLTGGDPLRRPDIKEIVAHGAGIGLRMAMTPSGTNQVTFKDIEDLKKSGLARLAVSLDGPDARTHDSFRKVDGSFDWTQRIIRWANELDLSVQINTTVTRYNHKDLNELATTLGQFKIALWSVFFLVPVGRGKMEDEITATEYENAFHQMADIAQNSRFDVKSTEAPHYRRVLIQRKKNISRVTKGVNDGKGFVFISHKGEIYPSGFLPVLAGNVKHDSLVDVYRSSPIFRMLRDASRLKGKCGACEFKSVCGGSRARAYAVTGDMMASDPFCTHVPNNYLVSDEERKFW